MEEPIGINDMVVIINSPYYSVPNGTAAIVETIKPDHFGENKHLYILDTRPCSSFREHEIKLIPRSYETE